jgi:hypothetical protein
MMSSAPQRIYVSLTANARDRDNELRNMVYNTQCPLTQFSNAVEYYVDFAFLGDP